MTYYIGIDTETSGLDPAKHGICEIGAVATTESGQVVDIYQSYCRPTRDLLITEIDHQFCTAVLDPRALKVNGLSIDFIEGQEPDFLVMVSFANWLKDFGDVRKVFCNAPFDLGFLNALARRSGKLEDFENGSYRSIDIVSVAHALLADRSMRSLSKICEATAVENRKEHSALSDALATITCYHELMREAPVSFSFSNTAGVYNHQ